MDEATVRGWWNALEPRERDEIAWACHYAWTFNHGTSGHLAYRMIAQLAEVAGLRALVQQHIAGVLERRARGE